MLLCTRCARLPFPVSNVLPSRYSYQYHSVRKCNAVEDLEEWKAGTAAGTFPGTMPGTVPGTPSAPILARPYKFEGVDKGDKARHERSARVV